MTEKWTNRAVQQDPQGYLAWKERQREEEERKRKEEAEERDYRDFERLFLERGGDPKDARAVYKKFRNEQALEEVAQLDRATRNSVQSQRRRAV